MLERPDRDERTEALQRPGLDGGLEATPGLYTQMEARHIFDREAEADDPLPEGPELRWDVQQDYRAICKYLCRAPKRRSFPEWSAPAEGWLQLLRPDYRSEGARRGVGIGATGLDKFYRLLTVVRRRAWPPMRWHCSRAHSISKGNGKRGVAGLRIIQCFDCVGLGWYNGVAYRGARWPAIQEWTQGSLPGRTREASIMGILSASWRANQVGRSHALTLL